MPGLVFKGKEYVYTNHALTAGTSMEMALARFRADTAK